MTLRSMAFGALFLAVLAGCDAKGETASNAANQDGHASPPAASSAPFTCPDVVSIESTLGGGDWVPNSYFDAKAGCAWGIMAPDGESAVEGVVVQHPILEDAPGTEHDLAWWRKTLDLTWADANRDADEYGDGSFIREYPGGCDIYTMAPDGKTMDVGMHINGGAVAAVNVCDQAGRVVHLIRGD